MDSGVDFGVIAAIVLSLMFVTFITLLVIKCVCCKSRGQPGRVTGEISRPRLMEYKYQYVIIMVCNKHQYSIRKTLMYFRDRR